MSPGGALAIRRLVLRLLSKVLHQHRRGQPTAGTPPSQGDRRSPLDLVCSACREGPFAYEGFRQAVSEAHYDDTTGYCYTTTWSQISESISKEACTWCRIVIRTRDELPADKFPSAVEEMVEVKFQVKKKTGNQVIIYLNGYKAATYTIYANLGNNANREIGAEVTTILKEPYIDYQKALERIKHCSGHEYCHKNEETYLPTRVIDCSDPARPRLVETRRQKRGRYCTLSYVWGGDQTQKTTSSNIGTYVREGINVPLPQTIADAILVTKKLGIRYLWVDALCIIQDSIEDKVRELGTMAHIYRDAYLTISVLSAFRADQGFLPDERVPDVLPFHLADRSIGRMLLEYNIPRRTPGLGKYETVVMHRPLDERGWCLQESTLTPRRLIFQPPHVWYKCRSFTEVEISRPSPLGRGLRDPTPVNDHILFPVNKVHGRRRAADENSDQELREQWRRMLLDYSQRKISVPSDKFVALASIVEVFQSALKDRYIAGLWQQDLLHGLLWETCPPMGPDEDLLPRPASYRAPTWSWASVDGKLYIPYSLEPPASAASYEAEILVCEATPKVSTLPFGELKDARLTMRVKMHPFMYGGRKCSIMEHKGIRTGNRMVSISTGWYWTPPVGNCLEPRSLSMEELSDEKQEDSERERAGIKFDCLEGAEKDRQKNFYVIILRAGRNWNKQGDWMQGLLVVRVESEVEQYRRVAILDLPYYSQWPGWFDAAPLSMVTLV